MARTKDNMELFNATVEPGTGKWLSDLSIVRRVNQEGTPNASLMLRLILDDYVNRYKNQLPDGLIERYDQLRNHHSSR